MINSHDWIRNIPIAHRGFFDNDKIAENSKSAIKKATDANYAVMVDVSFSNDHQPVIFHDESLSRMTNTSAYLSTLDANELTKTKLLNSADTILSVADVLNIVDKKVPIIFSIAGETPLPHAKALYEAIKNYQGEVAVTCANPYTLEWFKLNAPRIKRGQSASSFKHEKPSYAKKGKLKHLKLNNISEPNFVVYNIDDARRWYFKKLKKDNIPLVLGIVKTKKHHTKAKDYNANIIVETITPEF